MKKLIYIFITLFLLVGCKETSKIDISFVQNGKRIQPVNGIISLDKAPFDVVFNASDPFDIMVNASFSDSLYILAANPKPLTLQPQFKANAGMAEVLFNEDEGVYISYEATSIWYYEDEKNHKFNAIETQGESNNYIRTIKNINDADTLNNVEVDDINRAIYIVFLSVEKINGSVNTLKELQRLALKIEWNQTDDEIREPIKHKFYDDIKSYIRTRKIPLIDSTNFDSFIEEPYFFTKPEIKTLQLEKIYPDYHKGDNKYRITPSYRINLSENYNSLVITTYKNDNEMESVLINYELDGLLIDHEIVSYDETEEGVIHMTSKIDSQNIISTAIATWSGDIDKDITHSQIDENGFINQLELIDVILKHLNIDSDEVYKDFLSRVEIHEEKVLLFIPVIAEQTEDELIFDAYVLLVNPKTSEILSSFIEKKCWYSDAMQITSIEANYNPYRISENSEAIGITVSYYGSSRVNPFVSKELTLFNRREDVLERVLKDYEIYNRTEENDGDGNGFYNENKKTIMPQTDALTRFYNLKITDSIKEVEFENRIDKTVGKSSTTEYLKYQNGMYKKDTIN